MRKSTIVLLSCLYFVFSWIQIYAEPLGHIVIKKGKTIIHGQDADQIYDAATESKISIQQTDEVRTGEDSQLKMYLQNKKEVVQMYSESFVRINDSNDDETLISFMFG